MDRLVFTANAHIQLSAWAHCRPEFLGYAPIFMRDEPEYSGRLQCFKLYKVEGSHVISHLITRLHGNNLIIEFVNCNLFFIYSRFWHRGRLGALV